MWLHRLAFTVVLLWLAASASASPDAKRLYDDLLSSYDRYCQRNAHVLLGPAHEYVWGMIDNLTKWLKWTGANRKKNPTNWVLKQIAHSFAKIKPTYMTQVISGASSPYKTDQAIWKGVKYWARKCKILCTYILSLSFYYYLFRGCIHITFALRGEGGLTILFATYDPFEQTHRIFFLPSKNKHRDCEITLKYFRAIERENFFPLPLPSACVAGAAFLFVSNHIADVSNLP